MVRDIIEPLARGKFWLKLLGVMMIITGALQVLTIIGIVWAWLPIWLGVILFQAANAAELALTTEDPATARNAIDKLRLYFMIQGILMLIGLVLVGLMFAFGGLAMIAGLAGSAAGY